MADLRIEPRSGPALATVMARKGVAAAAIGAALGLSPPTWPGWARNSDGLMLIGTGAGSWLAYAEQGAASLAADLRERLAGLASVSDQSDGYAITRIWGASARTVLMRGAGLDFHTDVFKPGSAATTVIAHIGVIVWQLDDAPTYEIATFRSYADSFAHWLDQTIAAL